MSKEEFDKLLLEAIDEGLASIGESSKQAIYFHLEKGFNIKRQELPDKIADFQHAIEKLFGLGANFLEILVMKRLHEKTGVVFEWRESTEFAFTQYVTVAKRVFREKKGIKTTEDLLNAKKNKQKLK